VCGIACDMCFCLPCFPHTLDFFLSFFLFLLRLASYLHLSDLVRRMEALRFRICFYGCTYAWYSLWGLLGEILDCQFWGKWSCVKKLHNRKPGWDPVMQGLEHHCRVPALPGIGLLHGLFMAISFRSHCLSFAAARRVFRGQVCDGDDGLASLNS
jgi:hypothetical protein